MFRGRSCSPPPRDFHSDRHTDIFRAGVPSRLPWLGPQIFNLHRTRQHFSQGCLRDESATASGIGRGAPGNAGNGLDVQARQYFLVCNHRYSGKLQRYRLSQDIPNLTGRQNAGDLRRRRQVSDLPANRLQYLFALFLCKPFIQLRTMRGRSVVRHELFYRMVHEIHHNCICFSQCFPPIWRFIPALTNLVSCATWFSATAFLTSKAGAASSSTTGQLASFRN